MADKEYGFKTRAIHAGNIPDAVSGARALPIYQTSAFVFDDTADAAARFALQKYGNIYSRLANPTVAAFEERVASLEGGLGAVATSSGLGAEFITFASLAGAGDHIVSAASLYGGSVTQLDVTLRRFGVETTFIAGTNPEDYAAAITDKTKLIFTESITNPSGDIADLEGLAEVAHAGLCREGQREQRGQRHQPRAHAIASGGQIEEAGDAQQGGEGGQGDVGGADGGGAQAVDARQCRKWHGAHQPQRRPERRIPPRLHEAKARCRRPW